MLSAAQTVELATISQDFEYPKISDELVNEREEYKKSFRTSDGRVIHQYSKAPLHYLDQQDNWQTIDITPIHSNKSWQANRQKYPMDIDLQGNITVHNSHRSSIIYSLQSTEVLGKSIESLKNLEGIQDSTSIVWNWNDGMQYTATFRNNAIKTQVTLSHPVSFDTPSWKFQLNTAYHLENHPQLKHVLIITDDKNQVLGSIQPVFVYDHSGEFSLSNYQWKKNAQGYEIIAQLDHTWLNSPERSYPIVIDPLITGPTSTWTGGYMESCLIPNYNLDSIAVTIPGQVTITGVYVTGSFYADPFTIATMANGQMYFSTECGATQPLTVAPPTGNTPGTAYLEDIDYRNPLTCCMGASCNDRTIYVRMHIGRNIGAPGCDLNYIYYYPFTQWPFSVFIEGRTAEIGGSMLTVQPGTICSNECELTMRPYVRYGVPPYTVNHPWLAGPEMIGNNVTTCALNIQTSPLNITRPNCPEICDSTAQLIIPVPTVTDACGNSINGFPQKIVNVKPTPYITSMSDSMLICSGEQFQHNYDVCPDNAVVNWINSSWFTGTNNIDTTLYNTSNSNQQMWFWGNADLNGCQAEKDSFMLYISPNPVSNVSFPTSAFIDQPVQFNDSSSYPANPGTSWYWTFGDGSSSTDSSVIHIYPNVGTYEVCLIIESLTGCKDTICDTIEIIPPELTTPNVISPNGDNQNDVLYFEYLPFFGLSHLMVYNRWGMKVYESKDYQNNWDGENCVDGTYYYVIEIPGGKVYTSTLSIFRN